MTCPECKGTKFLTLLTSREPCATCAGTGTAPDPAHASFVNCDSWDVPPGYGLVVGKTTVKGPTVTVSYSTSTYKAPTPAEVAERDRLRKAFMEALDGIGYITVNIPAQPGTGRASTD